MKFITFGFVFFMMSPIFANQVKLKPLMTPPSQSTEIKSGLEKLSLSENAHALQLSEDFQKFVYSQLDSKINENNGQWPYSVEEKRLTLVGGLSQLRELTIRFKSLVQREGNDSSNTVVVRLYIPIKFTRYCDYKFPVSIFLHHILNEVEIIEKASQLMATGLFNEHAAFAVIHMPYYGERTDKSGTNKQFLTPNLHEFQKNMAQLILDTHVLKNILENMNDFDSSRINLSGISLGGVLGLTVGAFDQSYNSYSFIVGGGNLADILINRAKNRNDSEVAIAMKDLKDSEESLRIKLSAIDGFTWLHRYKNKKIQMVSASRDDIVDYQKSVKPFIDNVSKENIMTHQLNDDTHSPSGSVISKYRNVFKPLITYIVGTGETFSQACPATRNEN
jgi:hypothetical protein